jgi:hypothetical protein
MKNITEELNNIDNMPIMQVDDSLKIYSEQNRFAKKREAATDLIKQVGLPKQDLYLQPQELENSNSLISFQEKEIRKVWNDDEWWFSIVDVVSVLTDSKNPYSYWYSIKTREKNLREISCKFKLPSKNNKYRYTDCANTEGIVRIMMSIPSPNVGQIMLFLVATSKKSGYELNPQLRLERQKELEKVKANLNNI